MCFAWWLASFYGFLWSSKSTAMLFFGCEAGVCVRLFHLYMSASVPVLTLGFSREFRCSVYMRHLFCIVASLPRVIMCVAFSRHE